MGGNTKRRHYAEIFHNGWFAPNQFPCFPWVVLCWQCITEKQVKARHKHPRRVFLNGPYVAVSRLMLVLRIVAAAWQRRRQQKRRQNGSKLVSRRWNSCRTFGDFCCVMVQNPLLNFSEIDYFSILMSLRLKKKEKVKHKLFLFFFIHFLNHNIHPS